MTRRAIVKKRDIQTDFFLGFADGGFIGIFSWVHVPADAQPDAVFVMAPQEHLVFVNDERFNGQTQSVVGV
jgi:hypothetical protein